MLAGQADPAAVCLVRLLQLGQVELLLAARLVVVVAAYVAVARGESVRVAHCS